MPQTSSEWSGLVLKATATWYPAWPPTHRRTPSPPGTSRSTPAKCSRRCVWPPPPPPFGRHPKFYNKRFTAPVSYTHLRAHETSAHL
eukprot:8157309-Alexandrium_andersonii.AAC.1